MQNIYFRKDTGHYQVRKKIKGKNYSFGTYDTLEEAEHVRDYFKNLNWPISERLRFSKNRFIHYFRGKYHVNKVINGKKISFGTFEELEDAEYQVTLCKRFGWHKSLKPFDCMKYIQKRIHPTGKVVYRIIRWTPLGNEFYGTFNNLEDAQFERDFLILCDWDYEVMESLNETFDGESWITKFAKGNFIYKQPNGRIDYGVVK